MGSRRKIIINWNQFYHKIRGTDWPDCSSFKDVEHLPVDIQTEILNKHLGYLFNDDLRARARAAVVPRPLPQRSLLARNPREVIQLCQTDETDYFLDDLELPLISTTVCQGIEINYHPQMECGGITRAPMFIDALSLIAPDRIFNHCLDWCSGPGFIGFSLLGKGLCKKLDLADIWKPSLQAAKNVNVCDEIGIWHIRRLSDISPPRMYDLIVGNPPWFPGNLLKEFRLSCDSVDRNKCDPGLSVLKNFFSDAKNYLTPDGLIVLVEGQMYTGPKDISNVLVDTGLQLTQVLAYNDEWHWFAIIEHENN